MKNILFVSGSFYPATYYGGPIYSSYELAKGLAEIDCQVFICTTNSNGPKRLAVKTNKYLKLKDDLFVKYYGLGSKNGFSPFMFLLLWQDILKADIVYLISIFSPCTPLTIVICKILKKKLIISPRGQLGVWCLNQGSMFKKLWLKVFIHPFINNFTWHINSKEEQKDVKLVYPNARTFVIPNGIDTDIYENGNQSKKKLFYQKYTKDITINSLVMISMGRLHQVKGFNILINSFKVVKEKYDNFYLLIAGQDFGEKEELVKQINELKLNDRVYLIGNIEGEEKIDFLKNADVFALSSHHENFGLVYAEALAAGIPIVASKNTPWEEVEKYNCGKWVENTPEDFAKAIEEILNSNYEKMGDNGRKFIYENYNWEIIAKKYKEKLDEIGNNHE